MYVGDRDTFDDVFCQECGRIADRETLNALGLCEDCDMNTAHLAFYANRVLSELGMETIVVAFWDGLWKGVGDISVIPDWYVEASKQRIKRQLVAGMQRVFEETKAEIQASLDADYQRVTEIVNAAEEPLPDGDVLLYCQYCYKRTQHTETLTLPGGYPLLECVICDGGRL